MKHIEYEWTKGLYHDSGSRIKINYIFSTNEHALSTEVDVWSTNLSCPGPWFNYVRIK